MGPSASQWVPHAWNSTNKWELTSASPSIPWYLFLQEALKAELMNAKAPCSNSSWCAATSCREEPTPRRLLASHCNPTLVFHIPSWGKALNSASHPSPLHPGLSTPQSQWEPITSQRKPAPMPLPKASTCKVHPQPRQLPPVSLTSPALQGKPLPSASFL